MRYNMTSQQPDAAILIIGNEILSGRTADKNIQYIAQNLTAIGIRLHECRVVSDNEQAIIEAVNALRIEYDYVFTTGGIGPTHDDITAASIAKAFHLPLTLHPEAAARLENYYANQPEKELNNARLKMAYTPEGALLIDNPISAAPGFYVDNVYVLAGIPSVLHAMFDSIKHTLQTGNIIHSREILIPAPEGQFAKELGELQEQYPMVDIGSYPFLQDNKPATNVVIRCIDNTILDDVQKEVEKIQEIVG